jgi:hypothetical protein
MALVSKYKNYKHLWDIRPSVGARIYARRALTL